MQERKTKNFNALLCQTHPILKEKSKNISRIEAKLQKFIGEKLDLIMFPEMAFTGYNFKNQEDAFPLAIQFCIGQEFEFASRLATKFNCYILFGYIEKCHMKGKQVLYNSAAIIDRKGTPILNTRKTHLYYCDELWGKQGDGFKAIQLQNLSGQSFKCGIGICMDINPKNFTSGKYEFAEFLIENNCEIILFATNWIDSEPESETNSSSIQAFNHWLTRISPFIKKKRANHQNALFLAADRVGEEYSFYEKKKANFVGSSCALTINPPEVLRCLNKKDEDILLIKGALIV